MAKKKVSRKVKKVVDQTDAENFGEEIEVDEEVEVNDDADFMDAPKDEDVTFAEAKGTPANQKAKALAQAAAKEKAAKAHAEAKLKADEIAPNTFYTVKHANNGTQKVIKMVVTHKGVHQVYIGNMKRHKEGLEPLIKNWKAKGVFIGADSVEAKVAEIKSKMAPLVEKKKGK